MQRIPRTILLSIVLSGALPDLDADLATEGWDYISPSAITLWSSTTGETVTRSETSRFAWGAHAAGGTIQLVTQNTASNLAFSGGAFDSGSYVYTRFDRTTTPVSGANTPTITVDLSAASARAVLYHFKSPVTTQLSLMLRDGSGWWRSSAVSIPAYTNQPYNLYRRIEIDPKSLNWVELTNTTDMDQVDNGGSTGLTDGPAGTPVWGAIEGMGLMARSTTSGDVFFSGMALTEGPPIPVNQSKPVQHSDVMFVHQPAPLEKFDEYGGVKVVYWDQGWNADQIALTHNYGVRSSPALSMSTVPNTTAQSQLKSAICKDLWGDEIIEGDQNFPTGQVARLCIRYPSFLQYVKDYTRLRIYNVGAREALTDVPSGSNGNKVVLRNAAGCFCDVCNDGFRAWLDSRYTDPELAAMGIADIGTFDYRALMQAEVSNLSEYQTRFDSQTLPHMHEWVLFQQEPARAFFTAVRDYMYSLDPDFTLTSNSWDVQSQLMYLMEENESDFHGPEMELYFNNPGQFGILMGRMKLADAFGAKLVTSGVWWNWQWVRNTSHKATEVVKSVIAAFYASGHHLAAPDYYRWITPHYYGSTPEYAPWYRFVRQNADLFDDYLPVEQVGVLLDNSGYSAFIGDATFINDFQTICKELLNNHVPYGIAPAADGLFLQQQLTYAGVTDRFGYLVEPRNTDLSGTQLDAVNQLKGEGKAQVWIGSVSPVLAAVDSWVNCSHSNVWVLPRRHATDPSAPTVVHLLNRAVNHTANTVTAQSNVTVTLSDEIWGGLPVTAVTAHAAPEGGAVTSLAFSQTGNGISITVPQVGIWTILSIDHEGEPPPCTPETITLWDNSIEYVATPTPVGATSGWSFPTDDGNPKLTWGSPNGGTTYFNLVAGLLPAAADPRTPAFYGGWAILNYPDDPAYAYPLSARDATQNNTIMAGAGTCGEHVFGVLLLEPPGGLPSSSEIESLSVTLDTAFGPVDQDYRWALSDGSNLWISQTSLGTVGDSPLTFANALTDTMWALWNPSGGKAADLRLSTAGLTYDIDGASLAALTLAGIAYEFRSVVDYSWLDILRLAVTMGCPDQPVIVPTGLQVSFSGNDMRVSFDSVVDQYYQLEMSTDNMATWDPVGTPVAGDGALLTLTAPAAKPAVGESVFCRVVVGP